MYLTKKIYIGSNYNHNKVEATIEVKKDGKPVKVNPGKITYICEAAAYWRKANQIHRWFVENVQNGEDDCKSYYVEREQLQQLVDLCKEVLETPEKGPELLPTGAGFFFGGTEYDQYYLGGLKDTVEMLEPLIKEAEEKIYFEFSYQASW